MTPSTRTQWREQRRANAEARGSADTRLMGGRRELTRRAKELVEIAGARVQQEIAGDDEYISSLIKVLKDGSLLKDRTCMAAVLTILKLQGQERVLLVEYVRQLGASSEEEARRAVEAYRSAGGADLETAIERCTAFLEGALPMHEQHRGMVIRRLGGYLPVESGHASTEYP